MCEKGRLEIFLMYMGVKLKFACLLNLLSGCLDDIFPNHEMIAKTEKVKTNQIRSAQNQVSIKLRQSIRMFNENSLLELSY